MQSTSYILTHFLPSFHFYTPFKRQKTRGFQEVWKRKIGAKWIEGSLSTSWWLLFTRTPPHSWQNENLFSCLVFFHNRKESRDSYAIYAIHGALERDKKFNCSKLAINITEKHKWSRSGTFIMNLHAMTFLHTFFLLIKINNFQPSIKTLVAYFQRNAFVLQLKVYSFDSTRGAAEAATTFVLWKRVFLKLL